MQKRLIALDKPDLSIFSEEELERVDGLIDAVRHASAESISEAPHGRMWRLAKDQDSIPYEAAFVDDAPPTALDSVRARELIKQFGWDV